MCPTACKAINFWPDNQAARQSALPFFVLVRLCTACPWVVGWLVLRGERCGQAFGWRWPVETAQGICLKSESAGNPVARRAVVTSGSISDRPPEGDSGRKREGDHGRSPHPQGSTGLAGREKPEKSKWPSPGLWRWSCSRKVSHH